MAASYLSSLTLASSLLLLLLLALTFRPSQAQNTTQDFLAAHNAARTQVGVPPLTWNKTLESFAQSFADKVKKTCDNTLKSDGPYGENTASGYDAFTTLDAVSQWVNQKANYNRASNACVNGTDCTQYKQVVWRATERVGCASVVIGAGWPFVVCEYDPAGNVRGQKPY